MSDATAAAEEAEQAKAEQADVGAKVLRQTGAFAALRTLSSILTWGGVIILARVLGPRSFGAFDIGIFWIGLGHVIGDGGLGASLIRHRGELTRQHYRVVMTFALCIASTMAAAFFIAAPYIASLSGLSARELWALRAMTPLFVFPAFRVVPYVKLEREIDFAHIGRIELFANLARHLTAIGVALWSGSVWALIASQYALVVVQTCAAYYVRPGWAGVGWDKEIFKALSGYGTKVQLGNAFLYIKSNLGRGLLGFWLGATGVGVFSFGLGFVNVPSDAVNGLARVQFPAYARLSQDDPELYRLVRGTVRGALLVALPILGVLTTSADWTIVTIYGDKWLPAIPVIWALSLHVVCDILALHLITCVQGQGRAGLALLLYGLWSGGLVCCTIVTLTVTHGDLMWVGLSYGVASVFVAAALVFWVGRYLRRNLAADIAVPLAAAALGFVAAYFVRGAIHAPRFFIALSSVGTFLGVFALVLGVFERATISADAKSALAVLRRKKKA